MIKPEYQRPEDIVESLGGSVAIDNIGRFIFEDSHTKRPSWVNDFFGSSLQENDNIFTSSAKGVFIVPIEKNGVTTNFAVTFGVGRYLLKEGVTEERFGLKVVLNSVGSNSFRSINKTTLGSVPKQSHEQMSRDVAPADFGIDIEQDLISSVTAKSKDDKFGKIITGRDSLSVSVKVDTSNIKEFLSHCLTRYKSNDYKKDFEWIDQISEVRNKNIEDELTLTLVQSMNSGTMDKVWMAVPEVINWSEIKGFHYVRTPKSEIKEDLDIQDFISSLAGQTITIDILKHSYVFMISAQSDDSLGNWSVFRCMYAEITLKGKTYILNSGKWYEIANSFSEQVEKDFISIPESNLLFPECDVNDENSYNNIATTALTGSYCMDGKLIMHGGGHSSVEFCDIYTSDKKLVHVKKYAGSGVFSHLFSQGVVSGELFASDDSFRVKVNAKLPAGLKIPNPRQRPNTPEYEIVYGVISNKTTPLNLPFFSKVSLRNARKRLQSYGYEVSLKKIQQIEPVTTN